MPSDDLEQPPTPEQDARDRRTANIFLLCAGAICRSRTRKTASSRASSA